MEKVLEILRGYITEFEGITNMKFEGELRINNRLRTTLGRCWATCKHKDGKETYVPTKIEISGKAIESVTEKELKEILAHEFAHYYTYKNSGKHDHENIMFIEICKRLHTDPAPEIEVHIEEKYKYEVFCSCCGESMIRLSSAKSDIIKNSHLYRSTCCKKPLKIVQNY